MPSDRNGQWKQVFYSQWFLLGAICLVLLIIFNYGRAYYHNYQVRQEIIRLEDEVRRLQSKRLETLEILKYIQSPAFVEERARLELNLVKPGEKMALTTTTPFAGLNRQKPPAMIEQERLANPAKWWKYFFDNRTAS